MAEDSSRSPASGKPAVFISYAREDRDAALKLATELKARGVGIWLDSEHLKCGENWSESIREAIKDCGFAVIILSHASTQANRFISNEWAAIQESCWRRPDLPVCVIRVDATDVPPFLREWKVLSGEQESDLGFAAEQIGREMTKPRYWKAPSDEGAARLEAAERFDEIRKSLASWRRELVADGQ